MTKKKRFGISAALTRGLSETINVVENNTNTYRNVVLPLSRIELDPENPRKLVVDLIDVRHGIKDNDQHYLQKQAEIEKLKELAHTIKSSGIINPIVVYKRGELYRIVAGERRCLASLLIGKQEIDARVFMEKPKAFDLKLIQWVENTAREDLTLHERLDNIREIMDEYCKQNRDIEITATLLKSITGLSLSQTTYYLAALNAPEDVQLRIRDGSIRNLDKAALIANIHSPQVRQEAIAACVEGASLKELRLVVIRQKTIAKVDKRNNQGRLPQKINMGSTQNAAVIKTIITNMLAHKNMTKYHEAFTQTNWDDLRQTAKAFRKLIEILEIEMAAR